MIHTQLTQALKAVGADIEGAECHGMLCGMLASGVSFRSSAWLTHAAGREDLSPFGPEGSGHVVWDVLKATRKAFSDGACELRLVLPAENANIGERAGALVFWSRGFLSGFGLAGPLSFAELDAEARAFLEDLTRIARLDTRIEAAEENEQILTELEEFLRLGALMVFEQTSARSGTPVSPTADSAEPTLH